MFGLALVRVCAVMTYERGEEGPGEEGVGGHACLCVGRGNLKTDLLRPAPVPQHQAWQQWHRKIRVVRIGAGEEGRRRGEEEEGEEEGEGEEEEEEEGEGEEEGEEEEEEEEEEE